jgi:hypothetical protein
VIKFADDTTLIDLIIDGDETAYKSGVDRLAQYCQDNNLALNADETKELVVDFRRKRQIQDPIPINGSAMERVDSSDRPIYRPADICVFLRVSYRPIFFPVSAVYLFF